MGVVPVPTEGPEAEAAAAEYAAEAEYAEDVAAVAAGEGEGSAEADLAAGSSKDVDPRSRPWTEEEDHTVRSLVLSHGTKRWSLIAAQLNGRTGKQCRERWHNQLDPAIKKDNWTQEEDRTLLDAHRSLGSAGGSSSLPAPLPAVGSAP